MTPPAPTLEFGSTARTHWEFDSDLVFLNHGSFGAVPRDLQNRAIEVRREIERNPVEGVWRSGVRSIRRVAEEVAEFVGGHPDRTGFVTNATAAINAFLDSFPLEPGDEVLHLDHGYNAVWQTLLMVARRRGIVPRKVALAIPCRGASVVVETIMSACTKRTRLIVLDQITSPTALRLPVAEIVAAAKSLNIEVLVDGAHAPGMLDRPALEGDPAGWTGNLHKWPCAVRGCAVLCVRSDLAGQIKPPVISHSLDESYGAEFDWQGTFDPTPWLLAGEAIRFMDRFGGWNVVRERNHVLAVRMQEMLCRRFGVDPISPLDGSMLGCMATIPFPDRLQLGVEGPPPEVMQAELLAKHRIEIPVMDFAGRRHLRISCHVYNDSLDYERLADAMDAMDAMGAMVAIEKRGAVG